MTVEQVLNRYDDPARKGFDYHFITSELGTLDDREKSRPEFNYEITAFMLVPNANNAWKGHYYGPMFTLTNENGKPYENPSLSSIKYDMVNYWEQRISVTQNPLLKSQYLNLVVDFKKSVTGEDVNPLIVDSAIDCMIYISSNGYVSHSVIAVNYLKRAFVLSKGNNNNLDKVKKAFISFEEKYAKDDTAAGLWGIRFKLMLECRECFTRAEVNLLVEEHENRLKRLSSRNPNAKTEPALDPYAVEQEATLLANFYSKKKSTEDIKRVIYILEISHKRCFVGKPAMFQMGQLQRILQLYLLYGISTEKDRLTIEIQKVSTKAKAELVPQSIELKIPTEQLDTLYRYLLEGNHEEKLQKYVFNFIPKEHQQVASVKEQAKKYPMVFMMSNQLLDAKGRPSTVIGSIENDLEGHVVKQTSQVMQIEGILLRRVTESLTKSGDLSVDMLLEEMKKSPIFEEERIGVIAKALKFLFEGEALIATHILLPQIEHVIATLVEESGGSVLNVSSDGKGFTQKTLDQLLNEESVKNVLSPDASFYMHVLFTDIRGWNIRNNVVHGISSVGSFSTMITDRILHVLVMLSFVRKAR